MSKMCFKKGEKDPKIYFFGAKKIFNSYSLYRFSGCQLEFLQKAKTVAERIYFLDEKELKISSIKEENYRYDFLCKNIDPWNRHCENNIHRHVAMKSNRIKTF